MSQAIIIKSNKYGINLRLDHNMPFAELQSAVAQKFEESRKFFGSASLAVSFEGRNLSREEESELVKTIKAHSSIDIICIVDAQEEYTESFKEQIASFMDALRGKEGDIYWGDLKSGSSIESDNSVVLAGDVEEGAKIASKGNVIVMGAIHGYVYAGGAGDNDAYIMALEMNPSQLKIGDFFVKYGETEEKKEKPKKLRFREKGKSQEKTKTMEKVDPVIAQVKDGTIVMDPISRELFDKVRSF